MIHNLDQIEHAQFTGHDVAATLLRLAAAAEEFGVEGVEEVLCYASPDEHVTAEWIPEIVIRIRRPGATP